jgi:hypothetical protein
MRKLVQAKTPLQFFTRLHLTELTGLKASNLSELVEFLRQVSGSCVYHHTHRFLQQHQYLSPEPPNDFAYWVTEVLGEETLGEKLASIDTIQFSSIRALREKIIETIQDHLQNTPPAGLKFADPGEEFHFMKSISFIIPTHYFANDLRQFQDIVSRITIDSIYFHIFESRLRLERGQNDFSNWLDNSVNEKELAQNIANLDPYTFTLEDLRTSIIKLVKKRLDGYE